MSTERTVAGHAFLSYAREDSQAADRLQRTLEAAGIRVWRDTEDLWPGEDWRAKIRYAITDNALAFIACFSSNSVGREKSYQNEELRLAIDQLRQRRPGDPWLIPIRFDECAIPDWDIGAGRTLASIQRADLFGDRESEGIARLVAAVLRILSQHSPSATQNASSQSSTQPALMRMMHSFGSLSALSPDGRLLAVGTRTAGTSAVKLFDVLSGEAIRSMVGSAEPLGNLIFRPDGRVLAGSSGNDVVIWDPETGQQVRTMAIGNWVTRFLGAGGVWKMVFSPDGRTLATNSTTMLGSYASPRSIRLWDVETGKQCHVLKVHGVSARDFAFSPDGRLLASCEDHAVQLWDTATGQEQAMMPFRYTILTSVAFSPNGKILGTGEGHGIGLWHLPTGKRVGELNDVLIHGLAMSASGWIAGHTDHLVKLWDIATGQLRHTLTDHTKDVRSVEFSSDGRVLATRDSMNVHVWSMPPP